MSCHHLQGTNANFKTTVGAHLSTNRDPYFFRTRRNLLFFHLALAHRRRAAQDNDLVTVVETTLIDRFSTPHSELGAAAEVVLHSGQETFHQDQAQPQMGRRVNSPREQTPVPVYCLMEKQLGLVTWQLALAGSGVLAVKRS